MLKLIIFDMDGVIFEGKNFWLDFHIAINTDKFALALWKKYSDDDYTKLSNLTAQHWKGRSAAEYFELIRNRRMVDGVSDVFEYADQMSLKTAIISSGPLHLALRAQRQFNVTEIRANRLGIDEHGNFDGTVDVQVDDRRKDIAAQQVQKKLGILPNETALIGDGENDIPVTRLSALNVGYQVENVKAREHFSAVIDHGPLSAALGYLRDFQKSKAPIPSS